MSRRRVRGETPSRSASSLPGQYRWVCSRDSNRSVRELVFAMFPILAQLRSKSGRKAFYLGLNDDEGTPK
ncbi:hypothetical protein GCM10022380_20100 [Amycolatopsis tucumanensis]|uniref:Uncharacterized protein n=1 Tax=Amycolatopsis tucumanensis TaxID=401106 RepID=A0ABP7HRG4_9PSEU